MVVETVTETAVETAVVMAWRFLRHWQRPSFSGSQANDMWIICYVLLTLVEASGAETEAETVVVLVLMTASERDVQTVVETAVGMAVQVVTEMAVVMVATAMA